MHKANPAEFEKCFGSGTPALLDFGTLRVTDLTTPTWRTAFAAASKVPEFQHAQAVEFVEAYLKPSARLAHKNYLASWRWLVLLCDVSTQYGGGGCKNKLAAAHRTCGEFGLMDEFAELADGDKYNRRRAILRDSRIPDANWLWDSRVWGDL
jgi:hypothetical protein